MSVYRWVHRPYGRDRLYDVGILPDGSLHNPNGYPDDLVREAVEATDARRHERRSNAAKKAAVTRRQRQTRRVQRLATQTLLTKHGIGERQSCAVCGRRLEDQISIKRGIGPECWEQVMAGWLVLKTDKQP
jgi:hypothetical protein